MRKFTYVLFFIFLCLSYIYVSGGVYIGKKIISDAEVYKIAAKLINDNDDQATLPAVFILNTTESNAYSDGINLYITRALIQDLNDKHMIALVIGHELSHHMMHHVYKGKLMEYGLTSQNLESNADKMGAMFMLKSGYDICKGRDTFKIFKELWGDPPKSDAHPDNNHRYQQVTMPWCSQGVI